MQSSKGPTLTHHQQQQPQNVQQKEQPVVPPALAECGAFLAGYNETKRYTVQNLIGKGSYGVVCAAKDNLTGEMVAIKKIQNVFDNVADAHRILREVTLLRLLKHPDVVDIKHIMLPNDPNTFKDLYVVFELMESDLHTVIGANDDLTRDHHKVFLYQLLRGLNFMHINGVLHRDLKPKNILANSNCKLKICDFGLARPYTGIAGAMPLTPVFWTDYVATRWYRAPELCGSFYGRYNSAVDMWSIGCIFAEVLLGKPLFPGRDAVSQLQLITDLLGKPSPQIVDSIGNPRARKFLQALPAKEPRPLEAKFPNADPQALNLLARLLAFDPFDRPTAADALAHPYFAGLPNAVQQETVPVAANFDFEACTLSETDVRHLIYREALQYHPTVLAAYEARMTASRAAGGPEPGISLGSGSCRSNPYTLASSASDVTVQFMLRHMDSQDSGCSEGDREISSGLQQQQQQAGGMGMGSAPLEMPHWMYPPAHQPQQQLAPHHSQQQQQQALGAQQQHYAHAPYHYPQQQQQQQQAPHHVSHPHHHLQSHPQVQSHYVPPPQQQGYPQQQQQQSYQHTSVAGVAAAPPGGYYGQQLQQQQPTQRMTPTKLGAGGYGGAAGSYGHTPEPFYMAVAGALRPDYAGVGPKLPSNFCQFALHQDADCCTSADGDFDDASSWTTGRRLSISSASVSLSELACDTAPSEAELLSAALADLHLLNCTPVRLLGTGATCHVELVHVELRHSPLCGGALASVMPAARKVIPRNRDPHLRSVDDALFAREQEGLRAGSTCPFFMRQLGSAVHADRLELLLELALGDTLEHELSIALGAIPGELKAPLLPPARIAQVAAATFAALAQLHARGYAHLDVKPANVFVTGERRLMLGDAGCMERAGADGLVQGSGPGVSPRAGTPLYLPPEAKRRGTAFCPRAADVYGVGVMLAVCAAWHRQTGRVLAYLRGDVALPEHVPAALADLAARCTAVDPAARPTAAEALQHPFLAEVDLEEIAPRRSGGAPPR
ncbi:Mitogen-activated protein kinase 15 [Tetrabaena socialis]|uniref:Mitogen-activated protein kinase n=1 Tax=Tetrabaena socialis TaxID=47790 RepID=A0A2J8A5T6_9CHLO|nr:Mitogen-activated protein kinase 15 [Tetrabaena socialis]|eukprot:PNH07865.1 Mitogen-activated protein kinase 15 [Tetrabaena socialis]